MGRNEDKVDTINVNDVLNAITDYNAANDRPCPKTFLAGKFGVNVLDLLDNMKEKKQIIGKRGRNGGFVLSVDAASELPVTPVMVQDDAPSEAPAVEVAPAVENGETISQEDAEKIFNEIAFPVVMQQETQLDESAPF